MAYVHPLLSKVKTQDWRPHVCFQGGHGGQAATDPSSVAWGGREAVKAPVSPFLPEPGLRARWGREEERPGSLSESQDGGCGSVPHLW